MGKIGNFAANKIICCTAREKKSAEVPDKSEVKTESIVSAFGFTETTAKRYLRQLTEFGYLEAHGGNKNRTYTKKSSTTIGFIGSK